MLGGDIYKVGEETAFYEAMNELAILYQEFMADNPIGDTKHMGEYSQLNNQRKIACFTALAETHPELLETVGMSKPAVVIDDFENGTPRAYFRYADPHIVHKHFGSSDFDVFLFVPHHYNGQPAFVPEGLEKLDEAGFAAYNKSTESNYAEGWGSPPIPVYRRPRQGVELPADYDPEHHHAYQPRIDNLEAVFLAEGTAKELVDAWEASESDYKVASSAYLAELERIVREELADYFNDQLPEGKGFYINQSYTYGGYGPTGKKPQFEISPRIENSGEPLKLENNQFFHVTDTRYGNNYIGPNLDTEEGQKLQELYDAIPDYISFSEVSDLIPNGDEARTPRISHLAGKTFLLYPERDGQSLPEDFCPEDAVPVGLDVYHWLELDTEDAKDGVQAPPTPHDLEPKISDILNDGIDITD